MATMPPMTSNGGIIGQLTQYGYPSNPTPDYNTTVKKIGMRANPLTPHTAALTASMAQKLKAQPGDVIEEIDAKGNKRMSDYGHAAPERNARVDLNQSQGFDSSLADSGRVNAI